MSLTTGKTHRVQAALRFYIPTSAIRGGLEAALRFGISSFAKWSELLMHQTNIHSSGVPDEDSFCSGGSVV